MKDRNLTAFLDSLEGAYGVKATDCIVTKDHKVVYRHMTGHKDYAGKIPVGESDMYYFYSCTKVVTCVAVLKLIENGKIHLYDPVFRYLPEFEIMRVTNRFAEEMPANHLTSPVMDEACHYAKHPIRIMDLMAMMGGMSYQVTAKELQDARNASGGRASTREMVAAMAKMPLVFEPGTRWYYSLAHDVLAAVIEVASGKSFGEFLQTELFLPLGITEDLAFHLNQEQTKRLSAIYMYSFEKNKIVPCKRDESFKLTPAYESGGAGLIGTVNGYSQILDALACGGIGANKNRILNEETVRMLSDSVTTGQALYDIQKQEGPEYGYGLGVRVKINNKRGRGAVGEFGWGGAAGAYACVDPVHKVSILYVQHVLNHSVCGQVFHPIIRDLAYLEAGV